MALPITEDFGGGERAFLCRQGEINKIQEACGEGCFEIAGSLARFVQIQRTHPKAALFEQLLMISGNTIRAEFIRAPIFYGLIAGGMSPGDATKLVREWIEERGFIGLVENVTLAMLILIAGVSLPPGAEPVGEPQAGPTAPPASTSATSTERPPQSGGPRDKPTSARSGSSPKPSAAGTGRRAARTK